MKAELFRHFWLTGVAAQSLADEIINGGNDLSAALSEAAAASAETAFPLVWDGASGAAWTLAASNIAAQISEMRGVILFGPSVARTPGAEIVAHKICEGLRVCTLHHKVLDKIRVAGI